MPKFNIKQLYLTDNNGKPSVTTTAFLLGFIVICIKLLLSGVEYKGIKMSDFTGTDFGIAMAALGGVYVMRNNNKEAEAKSVE